MDELLLPSNPCIAALLLLSLLMVVVVVVVVVVASNRRIIRALREISCQLQLIKLT